MISRLKNISRKRYTWCNCTGNVKVTPLRFFYPRTEKDIADIVRAAENEGLRVRAVGSGHSFSEAAKEKDYLLSMKYISGLAKTPYANLKKKYRNLPLVDVKAGTVISKLNRELDKMELALINMGVIDVQTISGAIMTGTHGTGLNKPSMPDMVRSLKLVGNGGKLYQIEPTDGLTHPKEQAPDGDIKLIQDDDIFYSTILSFGGMGIIYELTLEVRPRYWMKETRYLMPWSKLEQQLLSREFMRKLEDKDFVAFRVNPYRIKDDHRCAVVEQDICELKEKPSELSALTKNVLYTIFSNLEFAIENSIKRFRKSPQRVSKTIQLGLWATKDTTYFNRSYKVLYQAGNAVLRHGISAEFAFEAKPEKIVQVLKKIFKQAEKNAKQSSMYQSSYISVRFVKPSKAYLSSAYGRKTVYIDIPMLYGTTGDIETLERYQEIMMEMGGIPHWGKLNSRLYLHQDFIRKQFCKVDQWIEARNAMDRNGTFLNDFIVKMGLGKKRSRIDSPKVVESTLRLV